MPRWGWGGGRDVNVPCDLLSLLMLRHAGVAVGGDVNVPTFHVNPVKAYVDMSWMQSDREKNSMQSVPVPEKTWLDR